jgi:L-seryl-tRNA(Ser) seleniumtransferase
LKGALDEIPVVRMLRATESDLQTRAEAFGTRVGDVATVVKLESVVGGGSAPETSLPSWGVALTINGVSETELESRLRKSTPPVIVRVADGRVILDFRTLFAEEEDELLGIIRKASSDD